MSSKNDERKVTKRVLWGKVKVYETKPQAAPVLRLPITNTKEACQNQIIKSQPSGNKDLKPKQETHRNFLKCACRKFYQAKAASNFSGAISLLKSDGSVLPPQYLSPKISIPENKHTCGSKETKKQKKKCRTCNLSLLKCECVNQNKKSNLEKPVTVVVIPKNPISPECPCFPVEKAKKRKVGGKKVIQEIKPIQKKVEPFATEEEPLTESLEKSEKLSIIVSVHSEDNSTEVKEPSVHDEKIIEPPIHEEAEKEPSIYEDAVEELSIHEEAIKEPSIYEVALVEPSINEAPITEPSTHEEAVVEPSVHEEAVVVEPSIHEVVVIEPSLHEETVVEPSINEVPITEPSTHKEAVVEPSVHEEAVVEPSIHEEAVIEPFLHEETVVEPSVHEESVVEPSFHEETVVEPSIHEKAIAEPSIHKETVVEPSIHDEGIVEPSIHEEKILEPSIHEEKIVEPSIHEEAIIEPPINEDTLVQPSEEKIVVEPSIPEGTVLEPSIHEETLVEPSIHEDTVIEPSIHEGTIVEPSIHEAEVEPFMNKDEEILEPSPQPGVIEESPEVELVEKSKPKRCLPCRKPCKTCGTKLAKRTSQIQTDAQADGKRLCHCCDITLNAPEALKDKCEQWEKKAKGKILVCKCCWKNIKEIRKKKSIDNAPSTSRLGATNNVYDYSKEEAGTSCQNERSLTSLTAEMTYSQVTVRNCLRCKDTLKAFPLAGKESIPKLAKEEAIRESSLKPEIVEESPVVEVVKKSKPTKCLPCRKLSKTCGSKLNKRTSQMRTEDQADVKKVCHCCGITLKAPEALKSGQWEQQANGKILVCKGCWKNFNEIQKKGSDNAASTSRSIATNQVHHYNTQEAGTSCQNEKSLTCLTPETTDSQVIDRNGVGCKDLLEAPPPAVNENISKPMDSHRALNELCLCHNVAINTNPIECLDKPQQCLVRPSICKKCRKKERLPKKIDSSTCRK